MRERKERVKGGRVVLNNDNQNARKRQWAAKDNTWTGLNWKGGSKRKMERKDEKERVKKERETLKKKGKDREIDR